ncbi:MAG: mechanosensitive ion channel family protein [Clostridia bacterium]|nr:mechanosensitive ion channel family protein [Clostridia bacterium]
MDFVVLNVFAGFFDQLKENWLDYVWIVASIVITFIAARIAVALIARVMRSVTRYRCKNANPEKVRKMETAETLTNSILKYVIYFIAVAIALGQLGLGATMRSMLATAGIGGLAIGIGAQSLIKDVVTGFFMLFEDQLSVGDYVTIDTISGTVEEITLRTTSIRGVRGELNVIPNGSILVMTNYSRGDYWAQIPVDIAYEADVERAQQLMLEEAKKYAAAHDYVIGEPSVTGILAMKASGVTIRLDIRVKQLKHWETERALAIAIKERFSEEGIEIPYSKVVVLHTDKEEHRA